MLAEWTAVGRNWLQSLGVTHVERFAYAFMLGLFGIFLAYTGFNAPKRKKIGLQLKMSSEQDSLNKILRQGKEGEDLVNSVISELRHSMDFTSASKTWMPSDEGIADIVIPDDRDKLSKEIDLLLVTQDKVFVIEVKHWKGEINFKDGNTYIDGVLTDRTSPEQQTKSKVGVFNRLINHQKNEGSNKHKNIGLAHIIPIYVFSHPQSKINPNLPHNFITLAALPSLLGFHRELLTAVVIKQS